MLLHARATSAEREPIELNELIESSFNLAYHGARARDSSLELNIEKDFAQIHGKVEASRTDISRVVLNLIGNAVYSMRQKQKRSGPGASYRPTLRIATRDAGSQVEIRIWDNGIGISKEIQGKLFSPFFTTKPPGEGTGLGLSISHDIVVHGHQGQINVETTPDEYAEFIVVLPKKDGLEGVISKKAASSERSRADQTPAG
jgi:signal transduction histidine kinase